MARKRSIKREYKKEHNGEQTDVWPETVKIVGRQGVVKPKAVKRPRKVVVTETQIELMSEGGPGGKGGYVGYVVGRLDDEVTEGSCDCRVEIPDVKNGEYSF